MSFMLLGILNSQVSGGGAGAFDLLETQTLASSAASVTFTGLDAYSDYKHLQIRYVARNSYAGTGTSGFAMQLNGDTGSNYSYHELTGNGSSVYSFGLTSQSKITLGRVSNNNDASGSFGAGVIDVLDFSSTAKNTTVRNLSGAKSDASPFYVGLNSGAYLSTSAITSVSLFVPSYNLLAGSRFSLYGVK